MVGEKEIEEIIGGMKKGNQDSFSDFFNLYYKYVYYIVSKYVTSNQDREDLVQSSFILIFRNIGSLRNVNCILNWMGKIVATTYKERKEYHSRLKRKGEMCEEDINELQGLYEEEELLPDNILLKNEEKEKVSELIATLPEKQKKMVFLFYYQGFSAKEISKIEGCSEVSIWNSLFKARSTLKKKMTVNRGKRYFGSFIVLAFQRELQLFQTSNEEKENIWESLAMSLKWIGKIVALKSVVMSIGFLTLAAVAIVAVPAIASLNGRAAEILPLNLEEVVSADIYDTAVEIPEEVVTENTVIEENSTVGEGEEINYEVITEVMGTTLDSNTVNNEDGGMLSDSPTTEDTSLLTIYDFISYGEADFILSLEYSFLPEGEALNMVWDIFDNNGFSLRDTRYESGNQRYLYKLRRGNSILYIGVYRDMANRVIGVKHIVKGVAEEYTEVYLLDGLW